MESNALIVKLLHGKDVRAFNFFQKLNVYARASLVSDDPSKKLDQSQSQSQQQQQRTPTVRECDGDPEWKHEMRFDLSGIPLGDCAHVLLSVDLFHEGVMFGDKHIGEVRVPLADLAEQGDGVVRFVSYQVKNPEGKPNGVLTFSYSVHGKGAAGDSAAAAAGTAPGPIIGGYPVVNPPPPHGGWVEAGAAGSENQPSSPEIKYPMIDFQSEPGEAYPVAVPYESYYPPPESYYPHPPKMLHPLPPPPPPPPPPFAHGPCHYPPGPPPFRPWRHGPHGFGGGWRGAPWERDRGLSYWNGR